MDLFAGNNKLSRRWIPKTRFRTSNSEKRSGGKKRFPLNFSKNESTSLTRSALSVLMCPVLSVLCLLRKSFRKRVLPNR